MAYPVPNWSYGPSKGSKSDDLESKDRSRLRRDPPSQLPPPPPPPPPNPIRKSLRSHRSLVVRGPPPPPPPPPPRIYPGVKQQSPLDDAANRFIQSLREVWRKEKEASLYQRRKWIHEVFLSFRREDTCASFTSHLYAALQNAGINVFKDDVSLRRGYQISTSLPRAIKDSQVAVIVFSTNYADSRWCLEELEKIMECHRTIGQVVLPVFCGVDPSQVRRQTGEFGKKFHNLINTMLMDEDNFLLNNQAARCKRWREALRQAGGIAGFVVLNSRNESEAIENIVEHFTRLLHKTDLIIADNPVGVESRVQDMIQLLDIQKSDEVLLLGVWGMGGIGKTTIAKAIYNKIGHNFQGRSFLANVREVWEQDAGQVRLQEQLHFDIFRKPTNKIHSTESGCQRILLVLDDVNKLDQLSALCGSREWFGYGSRIIITTRDKHLLSGNRVDQIYTMKEMDESESIELFSWHAFKQASPREDFAETSRFIVKYSGGLPLALEVLGSYLFGRSLTVWKNVLETLKRFPNDQLQKKLKISYDSLNDDTKEIFLNIAFFFIGMDRNDVIHILNGCGLFSEIGISILVERSLVTVDDKNKLGMHDLLRDMGREITHDTLQQVAQEKIYDVFLSFRGIDSGAKFISHLYASLIHAGIYVFRGDDEIQRGDMISISLLRTIGRSRICIVVLSKHYANSKWSMLELENIMEHHRRMGLVVVPVFYKVDPSDVRHQTGDFGKAFHDLVKRIPIDEDGRVKKWRRALHEVCSSVDINPRKEGEDINEVVEFVTNFLDKRAFFVAEHPVGVESRVQAVIQLLNSHQSKDPQLLGIWGMGGMGKTTIAKAVYNQVGGDYEAKSFLLNVREVCKQDDGIVSLQQQLLSDILKTTRQKLTYDTFESGESLLRRTLKYRKILLILDGVNEWKQLNALCGSREWFGAGSMIIITTRDRSLLKMLGVDCVYKVTELDQSESLELFSWHAFKQAGPKETHLEFSRELVAYSGGLPLALVVLGSLLFRRVASEWKTILQRLKREPNSEVQKILRTSFEDLGEMEKVVFLDIACFYIGWDLNDVLPIYAFSAKFAIEVLEDKSLVDENKKLGMHVLLQHMGREIQREESLQVAQAKIYDVFLNFRGEDSRVKFISHLYSSLQNAGIYVFRDNDEIQRGDMISVSLLRAIRKSKISIVVLSKNYGNSKWCMLELENIMEDRRSMGMVVVPVFYEVDPSDVRNQTGEFGKAFEDLITRISLDEEWRVNNWRRALLEIGASAGVVVINSRNESEDINKVVKDVTDLLGKTNLFVADHPVGIEPRVQDVIRLLKIHLSKDPLLLGIWGMGGLGKTTIAKAVYNQIGHDFEAKSFLLNVREVCEQNNGIVSLQQKLLSDIYKTTKIKIDNVESGKVELKRRLSQKTIFLVLDDVNKLDQLSALCGSSEWFGQRSRIIITTRDENIVKKEFGVEVVYRIKQMNDNESLELFSWHAFKQPSPGEGFARISIDVVKYCGALPLALQVIGSFLLTRKRKNEWSSVLKKLKFIPNNEVMKKLKISFDGLSDDDIKEIFLDIAFFFIGMDQNDVIEILNDCGRHAEIGISVLVQQSLVTIDRKNRIGMHDLLRDMGREIVKQSTESGKEPNRLWRYEDVEFVLSKDARRTDVKGLTLKSPEKDTTYNLEGKTFEKMDKLRLLQLAGVKLDGDYKYLSRDLRWLCWHRFPLKYTPEDLQQKCLVSIDFRYSNLQQVWKKSQCLKKLKFLNLSYSSNLRQTPDFSNLPNLEKLVLKNCTSLSSISHTIGNLNELLLINLKNCTSLCTLPRSIYKLKKLKTLILSGCTKIDKLEEDMEQMVSLTTLVADNTAITRIPFALARSKSIGYISLCGYEGFARDVFPSIILSWMSPTNNILSQVQTSVAGMSLDFLDEQNSRFYGLLYALKDLSDLRRLWVKCDSEDQLSQSVGRILHALRTTNCEELEATSSTSQVSNNSSALIACHSQVRISGSKTSSTSLLIQMGMNCHVTDILKETISQKMSPIGSGLLPGDNYPEWLTFNSECSSVSFEVPQVDGRNLRTIMCTVHSSSPDKITSEGLKNVLMINYTKNTIQLYKKDALDSFNEEEWQKVVSNIEHGNKVKVVVVFEDGFIVKKTTVHLIYDEPIDMKTEHYHEPDKNVVSGSDENRFGRLFFMLLSLVRALLTSQSFWCGLAGILIGSLLFRPAKE